MRIYRPERLVFAIALFALALLLGYRAAILVEPEHRLTVVVALAVSWSLFAFAGATIHWLWRESRTRGTITRHMHTPLYDDSKPLTQDPRHQRARRGRRAPPIPPPPKQ